MTQHVYTGDNNMSIQGWRDDNNRRTIKRYDNILIMQGEGLHPNAAWGREGGIEGQPYDKKGWRRVKLRV